VSSFSSACHHAIRCVSIHCHYLTEAFDAGLLMSKLCRVSTAPYEPSCKNDGRMAALIIARRCALARCARDVSERTLAGGGNRSTHCRILSPCGWRRELTCTSLSSPLSHVCCSCLSSGAYVCIDAPREVRPSAAVVAPSLRARTNQGMYVYCR
jgi:hypothetical protein